MILQKTLKKTIVFITHDLNEALLLGDRIAIMKDGRFVQVGTPQEIVASPADDYVAAFVGDIDRGRVFRAADIARPPETLQLGDSRQRALDRMQELGRSALYVVAADQIAGVLRHEDLAQGGGGLHDLVQPFPSTSPDVKLHELYATAARGLPIAVLDSRGALSGVVELDDLFACLAGGPIAHAAQTDGAS